MNVHQQRVMLHRLLLTVAGALFSVSAEGRSGKLFVVSSGVNLSDPSLNSAEFWRDYYARLSKLQQPLDNNTSVAVTVQVGQTAALSCPVRNLGSRPVSWIRRRDYHVISSRSSLFTTDGRFTVRRHRDGTTEDWALAIRPALATDAGVYECQVSTGKGSLSRFVNLTTVVPAARLVGASVHRIEKGSVVTLLCIVDGAIAPVTVQWLHNTRPVVADDRRQIHTTSAPTASGPRSQLHVRDVTFLDSGIYSCSGDHLRPASVHVFVTEGDKTAAIQRRKSAANQHAADLLLIMSLLWLLAR